jgi:hypothetical protein
MLIELNKEIPARFSSKVIFFQSPFCFSTRVSEIAPFSASGNLNHLLSMDFKAAAEV